MMKLTDFLMHPLAGNIMLVVLIALNVCWFLLNVVWHYGWC